MTSSDPWNMKPTHIDWSEQVEEELQRGPLPQDTSSAFPTLDEAAKTTKGGKKKKGGQQKLSYSEFMSAEKSGGGHGSFRSGDGRRLTDSEIMMLLPTAPREKDPNAPQRNWNARQGFQRGYEREDRGRRPRERDDEFFPSRADESDNWGADRRTSARTYDRTPSRGSSRSGYDERESHFSRASETDNWSRDNRFQPTHRHGGYEDRTRRGYGFHSSGMHQRLGEDRWSRGGAPTPPPSDTSSQGRKPLMLSKRTKPVPETGAAPDIAPSRSKNNPFGDARPREDILRERGTSSDVFSSNRSDIASDQDFRSQPGSPGGSYRGSSVSGVEPRNEVMPRPRQREDPFGGAKPRADPFGGARPREDVLNERGNRSSDEEYKTESAAQNMEKIAQHIEAV